MFLGIGLFVVITALGVMGLASAPKQRELSQQEKVGEKLFLDLRCQTCHGINGGGGSAGPDLAGATMNDPSKLRTLLRNPQAFNPRSIMPKYELSSAQMEGIVAFLRSIGKNSQMPKSPAIGPKKPQGHFAEEWLTQHKYEVRKDPAQCSSCHKPQFCQTCHQNRRPDSHQKQWIKSHFGTAMEKPEYCAVCHERSFCTACHQDVLHTSQWLTEHKRGLEKRPEICKECHQSKDFCISCHKGAEPASHGPNWINTHKKSATRSCNVCHTQDFCSSCHTGATPQSHDARCGVGRTDVPRAWDVRNAITTRSASRVTRCPCLTRGDGGRVCTSHRLRGIPPLAERATTNHSARGVMFAASQARTPRNGDGTIKPP